MTIVPPQYRAKLEMLQKGVPPKPLAEVKGIIEKSLGKSFEELFQFFDEECIGSASVGQVHRARLVDGRQVVVKVQYSEVRELFASDFDQVIAAAKFWDSRVVADLKEARAHHIAECDFHREARIMGSIADNAEAVWGDKVVVPRPVKGLVSDDVLVMTLLPGDTLLDGLTRMGEAVSRVLSITVDELKEKLATHPVGIHPIALACAYSQVRLVSCCACATSCAAPSAKRKPPPPVVEVKAILQRLSKVLAHQVLADGLFTSDPHPGNIMILPDGRLGLIDFGQAKELTTKQRVYLSRVVVAVARKDRAAILELAKESPFRTKYNNPDAMVKYTSVVWEGELDELEKLAVVDPVVQSDPEFLMVRRAVMMCHGLCAVIGTTLNVAQEWEPVARRVLAEEGYTLTGDSAQTSVPRWLRCCLPSMSLAPYRKRVVDGIGDL